MHMSIPEKEKDILRARTSSNNYQNPGRGRYLGVSVNVSEACFLEMMKMP